MSDFRIDKITNRDGSAGTQIAGITTFSGTSGMQLPVGPTEYRGGRGRAVYSINGGSSPYPNTLNYITIATTGNASDFGDLTELGKGGAASGSNSTRGIFAGGAVDPTNTSGIDYVTISSLGGASDFGDLVENTRFTSTVSDPTRTVIMGGYTKPSNKVINTIQYVTTATTGDSSDFGQLEQNQWLGGSACSPIRGVMMAGRAPGETNVCQYITIQTKGDARDFGDLTRANSYLPQGIMSSTTRGVCGSGYDGSNNTNVIDYITIATLGNATDFGDMTRATRATSAMSSTVRGVWAGGRNQSPGAMDNVIEYVTIASTGNATDFGDTTAAAGWNEGLSDCHGGLG